MEPPTRPQQIGAHRLASPVHPNPHTIELLEDRQARGAVGNRKVTFDYT